jgi:hypothetical protein
VHPGDLFTDHEQRAWIVDRALGSGSWSHALLVRSKAGDEAVLRIPLSKVELGDAVEARDRSEACADRCRQLTEVLRGAPSWAPALIGTATAADGRPMLLQRRYPSSAARRIEAGAPLTEILRVTQRTADVLRDAGRIHGALHGRNILLDEAGRPVLSDVWTPAAARCGVAADGTRPPDAAAAPDSGWDAWALCALLYQAALTASPAADGRRTGPVRVPEAGLDKVAIATLKDRALARLAAERTNPRFRGRLADRLGAVLNRGLSHQHTPSPPYRFQSLSALLDRLGDGVALVDPRVEEVGRVLLPPEARDGVFQGSDVITFAITVATSTTLDTHEDLVCGVALRDLDAEGEARVPVPEARYETRKHPSGRLRFAFTLPGVSPGRYRVRVAFAVKDSGHPPTTAQGEFEVRPPPGWVPPVEDVAPAALTFPASATPAAPATRAPDPGPSGSPVTPAAAPEAGDPPSGPDAEIHAFPSPVSPPSAAVAPYPTPVAPPRAPAPSTPRAPYPVEVEIDVSEPGTAATGPSTEATVPQARPAGVSSSADTAPFESHMREAGTDAGWSGPGRWEANLPEPGLGSPFDDRPELPGFGGADDGEDLFGDGDDLDGMRPSGAFTRFVELVRRDAYTSVVAAVALSLILVVILTLLLKSC